MEAPSAYGEGRVRRVGHGMTAFRKERLQGLSCLKGNFHEQFLGGWAGAILPGYPALGRRTARQRALILPTGTWTLTYLA